GIGVADPLAIDDESIFMTAWRERDCCFPAGGGVFAHGSFFQVPIVKGAGDGGGLGLRHFQAKFDWFFSSLLGGALWCSTCGCCAGPCQRFCFFMSCLHDRFPLVRLLGWGDSIHGYWLWWFAGRDSMGYSPRE